MPPTGGPAGVPGCCTCTGEGVGSDCCLVNLVPTALYLSDLGGSHTLTYSATDASWHGRYDHSGTGGVIDTDPASPNYGFCIQGAQPSQVLLYRLYCGTVNSQQRFQLELKSMSCNAGGGPAANFPVNWDGVSAETAGKLLSKTTATSLNGQTCSPFFAQFSIVNIPPWRQIWDDFFGPGTRTVTITQ